MNAVTPFVFEDNLVRSMVLEDEPWFIGKDICHALGIKDYHQKLESLDDDERGGYAIPTPGGEQNVIIVSEPGVFRLIFTSRKAEAERFKRWLAHEVLPALRRDGHFALPKPKLHDAEGNRLDITSEAVPVLTAKLAMVREARHLWGHERARAIWKQLGLAVPVDDLGQGSAEGRHVLMLITNAAFSGHPVKHILDGAMNGDENSQLLLRAAGLLARPEEDGFVIANRHPEIERFLQGTSYTNACWHKALRRLPGATPTKPCHWPGAASARGIFIPMANLDFDTAEP